MYGLRNLCREVPEEDYSVALSWIGMKTLHIIYNISARSGKTRLIWRELKKLLTEQKIDFQAHRTLREGHATQITRSLCALPDPAVYIAVLGGDGTINEVLNGITDFEKVRLGVMPTGSGNDFGRSLWIPKRPPDALEKIIACMQREEEGTAVPRIDLGQVRWNGCEVPRIFGISSGVGLDALVCKKALTSKLKKFLNRIHLGKLTYVLLTVQSLFSMDTAELSLICRTGADGEDAEETCIRMSRTIFAAAMNLRAEGGGVPMAPRAVPTDGLLSLCCASDIPKWKTFLFLPFLVAAKHEKIKGFSVFDVKELVLHADKPMVLHADGEYCGDVTEVTFTCLEGILQLLR